MEGAILLQRDCVEVMVKSFEKRLEKARSKPGFSQSKILHYEIMKEYFEAVATAKERGKPLAWIGLLFPPEILIAMDIVPFVLDQYSIQLLASGRGYEYFDLGEGCGFDKESCSPHLAIIGAASIGLFPRPDMIVCAGPQPCDSQSTMFDLLADMYDVPTHWVNLPYRVDEEAEQSYKHELEDMIKFLEEQTSRKMDYEKLRWLLENGRETQDYFIKIQELRNHIPSPIGCREAFSFFGPRMASEGLPKTAQFMKVLYEEIEARVEAGQGAVNPEIFRIVTNGAYPFWYMQLFDWMEREYGAVISVDLSNSYPLEPVGDTSDPLLCFARKTFHSNPAVKTAILPYTWVAQQIGLKAKEIRCNASIFFAHFGCKQGCGRHRVVIEEIRRQANIPSLVLDIDAGNPAVVSAATIRNRLQEYFSMLAA